MPRVGIGKDRECPHRHRALGLAVLPQSFRNLLWSVPQVHHGVRQILRGALGVLSERR